MTMDLFGEPAAPSSGVRSAKPDPLEGFEAFWKLYPRKVAKEYAKKFWVKARREASIAEIMSGLERFVAEVAGKEAQFIPHPATWLSHGRWADDPGANAAAPPPPRPGQVSPLHVTVAGRTAYDAALKAWRRGGRQGPMPKPEDF